MKTLCFLDSYSSNYPFVVVNFAVCPDLSPRPIRLAAGHLLLLLMLTMLTMRFQTIRKLSLFRILYFQRFWLEGWSLHLIANLLILTEGRQLTEGLIDRTQTQNSVKIKETPGKIFSLLKSLIYTSVLMSVRLIFFAPKDSRFCPLT